MRVGRNRIVAHFGETLADLSQPLPDLTPSPLSPSPSPSRRRDRQFHFQFRGDEREIFREKF